LLLHLPPGIRYHIRKDPLMPFEVHDKGLKRYTGNTINAHTKRNKNLSERHRQPSLQAKKNLEAAEKLKDALN